MKKGDKVLAVYYHIIQGVWKLEEAVVRLPLKRGDKVIGYKVFVDNGSALMQKYGVNLNKNRVFPLTQKRDAKKEFFLVKLENECPSKWEVPE